MKMSIDWLRSLYADCGDDIEILAERLSVAGLEVESIDPAATLASGVVVAEVLSAEQHPDADRLRVCQVSTGSGDPLTIVCGASNARAGIKVALIQLGGKLPSGDEIKACKLRGVASSGMLCAAGELGLEDDQKGIIEFPEDAPVGEDVMNYLGLSDQVLDIAITPNRGDCLGMQGLAREVRALNKDDYQPYSVQAISATHDDCVSVSLSAPEGCSRYVGRVVRGVSMQVSLPWWMKERLRRAGMNMVGNPVVDCVNYVMLETGQPMHAFDANQLTGSIDVRYAKEGESLLLLNDEEHNLTASSLLVTDEKGPVALAGVMGGKSSAVTNQTTDLFLEAAYFSPDVVASSARDNRVSSDSSYRFERGVDWELPVLAIERLTELLLSILGGSAGPTQKTDNPDMLPKRVTIKLPKKMIERYLGEPISEEAVCAYLLGLGMQVADSKDSWEVAVPSFRSDVTEAVDLIEEVARLYGYDQIAAQPLRGELMIPADAACARHRLVTSLKKYMVAQAFQEVVTYSFISPSLDQSFAMSDAFPSIVVANPISEDMSVMRQSLLPGLLGVWAHNSKRQCSRMQVFEYGQCFVAQEGGVAAYRQEDRLAGLLVGQRQSDHWEASSEAFDFFDVKRAVDQLLKAYHGKVSYEASAHPALHPHQQAKLLSESGRLVGYVGQCHPRLVEESGWRGQPMVFEVLADFVLTPYLPNCQPTSKFPSVRRDLSFVMPESTPVAKVSQFIEKNSGYLLIKLNVFDIFHSDTLGSEKKSVSYGLFFQDVSRTLVDREIDEIIQRVIVVLSDQFGIQLRE